MQSLSLAVYNLFVAGLRAGMWLAAWFHPKARLWVQGRRNWKESLRQKKGSLVGRHPVIWMHASSLGEFEQGRPVLEALRSRHPGAFIALTFFSPSGFTVQQHNSLADWTGYLPADTRRESHAFVSILQPDLVLWVKYEYWWHILDQLAQRHVPVLLISGLFRKRQPFFKWYGGLHRTMLSRFRHLFVQDEASLQLVTPLVKNDNVTISGDTRFDRVVAIQQQWQPVESVEQWINGRFPVVVAGSTWPEDEKELAHFIRTRDEVCWIIAPHNVTAGALADLSRAFPDSVKLSELESHQADSGRILIIDGVGKLSRIYKYGDIAFVGGGFAGTGVHNVLEPAVYGIPVVYGPEYEDYAEAVGLLQAGGSFTAGNALELEGKLKKLLSDAEFRENAGRAAAAYVRSHAGGTEIILAYIYANRLLIRS